MDPLFIIISVVILIMSVVIHEVAHGYAAYRLGDDTAHRLGRLTLNPIPHLDMVGSILLPALLVITQSPFFIAWAKPVPFNPANFTRHHRWGPAIVAIAGPLSNLILAIFFAIILRIVGPESLSVLGRSILSQIILINLVLMIFNLIPIPPLDGHHILRSALPKLTEKYHFRSGGALGMVGYFIAFMIIWQVIFPIVRPIYAFLTGDVL